MVFDIGLFHVCECWLCWLTVTYILGYDHNFCVLGNCWHSQSVSDSWQTFLGINESHWFCLGCWSLTVGLEPILAFIEQELGYSLDRLPMYRRPSPNTQILDNIIILKKMVISIMWNCWCHGGHAPFIHSLLWEEQGLMLWTEKLLQGATNLLFFSMRIMMS